jgi:ATP-dependent exoDNAse (exonuclease V) beta subunit
VKNFIVYKSSAGSGKTFTLVLEYLKLCLFDNNALKFKYKKILAITFTNKAASEMKNRVISALYQIIHEEKLSNIGELLLQHLNICKQVSIFGV